MLDKVSSRVSNSPQTSVVASSEAEKTPVPRIAVQTTTTSPDSKFGKAVKSRYSRAELKAATTGDLFGPASPLLPSSPLLMLDRVVRINDTDGDYNRGQAIAELSIDPKAWFFEHHFISDPVVPGSFLLESLWQLTGFFLSWSGYKGAGRVLSNGELRFLKELKNQQQTLVVSIDIRKIIQTTNVVCVANGIIYADNLPVCKATSMKVGVI